jgi:dimethylamine monooxygenase subunit A
MGLRSLDLDDWLWATPNRASELTRKAGLLDAAHDAVFAMTDAGRAPAEELAKLVEAFCDQRQWAAPTMPASTTDPFERAARRVQEDLCLMTHADSEWVLSAACVCFPSRWRLADKIGRSLTAIHGPVPGYAEDLDLPTNQLFDRLQPDRPRWRLNWSLLETSELHLPDPSGRAVTPRGQVLDDWWLRVERQTLRALPATGAVCFTIATSVVSLATALHNSPDRAEALAATLASAPPASRRYKGWDGVVDELVAALRSSADIE